jgi:c-di-GMP phosphodiesterase
MIVDLLKRLLGLAPAQRQDGGAAFEALNRQAPLRPAPAGESEPTEPSAPDGFVCRETILSRDQKVAAYHFMLQQGTRSRIASRSRRIHHVYAEVLVRNLIKMDVGGLLGHRRAFFDIPDSFLGHEALRMLPPDTAVPVLVTLPGPGAPSRERVLEQLAELKAEGFHFAVHADVLGSSEAWIAAEVEYVIVDADRADPKHLREFAAMLKASGARRQWLARSLPSQDEFLLCFNLGASLFQGPFITRREDWSGNSLGPNAARLADLLSRLRRDAETREIAEILKQDPALSLRLMRYINSAAMGLREQVTSIERALLQLGREKLYRWLSLLLYGADSSNPAAQALLETALVRARMLELLGAHRSTAERDALFLVGLLSLVDAVLRVPMEAALAQLAAAPEIEAAVARGEGPMAAMLALATACEGTDVGAIGEAAAAAGVDPSEAADAHVQALAWAIEVMAE